MSRILNARVAEIVMDIGASNIFITDTRVEFHGKDRYDGRYYFSHALPNYYADMSAAMTVINKIDRDAMTSDFSLTRDYEGIWSVKLKPAGCREELVFGHTPEMCMLLAALRSKGDGEWVDEYLKEITKP